MGSLYEHELIIYIILGLTLSTAILVYIKKQINWNKLTLQPVILTAYLATQIGKEELSVS